MNVTISLAQFHLEIAQPDKNVKSAQVYIAQAVARNSKLVLLPELWTSGYDLENAERYNHFNLNLFEDLKSLANQYQIGIGGSYLLAERDGFYNTFALFLPGETDPVLYRKIHLFRKMREHQFLQPGKTIVTAQLPWGQTGLSICYDLRFPELYRAIALRGSPLTSVVAEWPEARQEHWRVLLRARAIENQMFIAAVNTTGKVGDEVFSGHSAIVSPWGEILIEGSDQEDLLTAQIDLDIVEKIREDIPILKDRQPETYSE